MGTRTTPPLQPAPVIRDRIDRVLGSIPTPKAKPKKDTSRKREKKQEIPKGHPVRIGGASGQPIVSEEEPPPAPSTSMKLHYTDRELEEFRLRVRSRLGQVCFDIGQQQEAIDKNRIQGELAGSENSIQDHALVQIRRLTPVKLALERALVSIGLKEYGICKSCNPPHLIDERELFLVPDASACVVARRRAERN